MSLLSPDTEHAVIIPGEGLHLDGLLYIPQEAKGLVVFAHGSGSSRFSSRNQLVASRLQKAGLATLLFDLLTLEEDKIDNISREFRFDLALLSERLLLATAWLKEQPLIAHLNLGYFGASTGAGAALIAAAQEPDLIQAVVSRGGRPDLAAEALAQVKAPTLLLVGGSDETVIALNKKAMAEMKTINKLVIVPKATHLFEEPGALNQVAQLAEQWFLKYLV